jgi:hypothetical protein
MTDEEIQLLREVDEIIGSEEPEAPSFSFAKEVFEPGIM